MRILSKATLAIIKIIRIFAFHFKMVHVVQLVERQIVVLVVVGSSPTAHPKLLSCPFGRLFLCPGSVVAPVGPGAKVCV